MRNEFNVYQLNISGYLHSDSFDLPCDSFLHSFDSFTKLVAIVFLFTITFCSVVVSFLQFSIDLSIAWNDSFYLQLFNYRLYFILLSSFFVLRSSYFVLLS